MLKRKQKNTKCRKEQNSPPGKALWKFTQVQALAFWGQYVLNSGIANICLQKCLRDCISYAELLQEVS